MLLGPGVKVEIRMNASNEKTVVDMIASLFQAALPPALRRANQMVHLDGRFSSKHSQYMRKQWADSA